MHIRIHIHTRHRVRRRAQRPRATPAREHADAESHLRLPSPRSPARKPAQLASLTQLLLLLQASETCAPRETCWATSRTSNALVAHQRENGGRWCTPPYGGRWCAPPEELREPLERLERHCASKCSFISRYFAGGRERKRGSSARRSGAAVSASRQAAYCLFKSMCSYVHE